jgi:putative acetyltransferase
LADGLRIRPYRPGDAPVLRRVFASSVHMLAARDYRPEQLAAWAPHDHDAAQWADRMQRIQPFVAELDGTVAGFADVQSSGYIELFFVSGDHAGRGVATALMAHLEASAQAQGLAALHANVSLRAERFFLASGFVIEVRQEVERAGVMLRNARMRKVLTAAA